MKKVMFVTVGTSLFHSASWEPSLEVRMDIDHYAEWTGGNFIDKPEARKRSPNSGTIRRALESTLNTTNYERWTRRLAKELLEDEPDMVPMRFSAEMATILKLYQAETNFKSLAELLNSYTKIYIVHDDDGSEHARLPSVAAIHLESALNLLSGGYRIARTEPITGLSSTKAEDLIPALNRLVYQIKVNLDEAHQIDILASGGYKIYGVVLSALIPKLKCIARLLYIHEEGGMLLQIPNGSGNKTAPGATREGAEVDSIHVGSF